MDVNRFDTLTRSLSAANTRRGLVRLVAALPLVGALGLLLGEERANGQGNGAGASGGGSRRRRRARHHPGQDKHHRNGQARKACAKAGQTPDKGTRKRCCQGLTMDAGGRCAAPDPGPDPVPCTGLRPTASSPTQGLQEAIDAAEAGDTLTLCAGTWNLTSTVRIDKVLTVIGAGAGKTVLDGGDAVRVLSVVSRVTVMVQDLTITRGNAGTGGGLVTVGLLILQGVSVTGNHASTYGGGIDNGGTLTLAAGSRVSGNTAGYGGGGIVIFLGSVLVQTASSVTDNTAGTTGGGIENTFGTVMLQTGSRVTGNTASSAGGIHNDGGTVTLDSGAIICSNLPLNSQCSSAGSGSISGTCPAPRQTCPA